MSIDDIKKYYNRIIKLKQKDGKISTKQRLLLNIKNNEKIDEYYKELLNKLNDRLSIIFKLEEKDGILKGLNKISMLYISNNDKNIMDFENKILNLNNKKGKFIDAIRYNNSNMINHKVTIKM